jgi:cell wall-associated NlpC family hydrolase
MSMIQDPGAPYRRNPRTAADEFSKTDPALNRPDTMSGRFQAVFSDNSDAPFMSAIERGAMQTVDDVGRQNVELGEQAQKIAALTEAAERREAQRNFGTNQENFGTSAQQGTSSSGDRQVYQPDGSLSQPRQELLRQTSKYAGAPYVLGGRTAQGIDCSGLVMSVYNQAGFDITRHSATWQGRNIPGVRTAVNNLKPGDIVAWKDGSHIAIYAGNGQIWDASSKRGTTLRPLWASQDKVYGIAVRLPGE